jgi:hypothetical protein
MPIYPRPEEILIYEGTYFIAGWYYTEAGRLPAHDYYRNMSETDQERLDDMIEYFCNCSPGTFLPLTLYRVEDATNRIFAFKPRDERFFNFTTAGAKLILTNAYHKHSQKMAKHDLEQLRIAARYREDYLKRVKEGMYYAKQ